MRNDIIKSLKTAGMLSEQNLDLGFVSTGSYALNKICSGEYTGGIPIGLMTQFQGTSSSAKTVFVTHILAEAQKMGYYTMLIDAENAYNSKFAESLGIDPNNLIYITPESVEDTFDQMDKIVKEIRELDKDTPIVIGYDSIAVAPCKFELNRDNYDVDNTDGMRRANVTGSVLRKMNQLLQKNKIALVVINQQRSSMNMYGSPKKTAAGGKALFYYLSQEFETFAPPAERIKDDRDNIIGIRGKVVNTKNKVTLPYQTAQFELYFDKGLTPHYGILDLLVKDRIVDRSGAWYQYKDEPKFQAKTFNEGFMTDDKFKTLREKIGL
jgi:recombination protein RecA